MIPTFRRCWFRVTGPGFYFRVLTEGEVQAGQEIVKLFRAGDHDVAEIDALLYLPAIPPAGARALRIPALSGGWKASFPEMLGQSGQAPGTRSHRNKPAAGLARFPSARRDRINRESDTVISVHLADPRGRVCLPRCPGSS